MVLLSATPRPVAVNRATPSAFVAAVSFIIATKGASMDAETIWLGTGFPFRSRMVTYTFLVSPLEINIAHGITSIEAAVWSGPVTGVSLSGALDWQDTVSSTTSDNMFNRVFIAFADPNILFNPFQGVSSCLYLTSVCPQV